MEKDNVYIAHILDAIGAIEDYTKELTLELFIKPENRMVQDATIRELQVIGEAAKKLSEGLKSKNPTLPWREIAGMRDKLTHDYFGIDKKVVWFTVEKDLPVLKKAMKKLGASD
jgi:uncharacterized protein with HEPN domain